MYPIYKCLSECIELRNNMVFMCMKDCQSFMEVNLGKYTAPAIWVGLCIAAASLVCMLAMGTDLFNGFRVKESWFPCKIFTINASINAVMSIALKTPVSINTLMPCGRDQLMKLSSTALMSVCMANFMPSLAGIPDGELFANMMALAVFNVPFISNIFIQIGTGIIYRDISVQHIIIIFCISIQFGLLISTAIVCPTIKQQLEEAYNKEAKSEEDTKAKSEEDTNKKYLKKHWIMSQTGSPQFVIARSVLCTASGAICVLTILVLTEAVIQLYITMSRKLIFFDPSSDYDWSANVILLVQIVAVLVGSISPISRWFMAVWLKFQGWPKSSPKQDLSTVEEYWTKRLEELQQSPLWLITDKVQIPKHISGTAHTGKNIILTFFIKFQNLTVLSCKFICLLSLVFLFPFMFVYQIIVPEKTMDYESRWVLKLKNEPEFPESTIEEIINGLDSHIKKGTKETVSKNQINLLKKSNGFDGVMEFDKNFIERLTEINIKGVSNNPNRSWAIRIVTLSTIICAINWEKEFVSTVNEILPLVIYVENALSHGATARQTMIDVGYLATNVWSSVHDSKKWLNTKLPIDKSSDYMNGEALKKFLETLKEPSQKKQRDGIIEGWMKETAKIVIEFLSSGKLNVEKKIEVQQLHDKMTRMVLDMLVACLVNIERAISANISNASIEKRESVVKEAVSIHGKTIEIQSFVKERFSTVEKDHREYLQASWWKFVMPKTPLQYAIIRDS